MPTAPNTLRLDLLRCPKCLGCLNKTQKGIFCESCNCSYPLINNVPVLLVGGKTLFSEKDVVATNQYGGVKAWLRRLVPPMGHNLNAKKGYKLFIENLEKVSTSNKKVVLVVGAGGGGIGSEILYSNKNIDVINLDVTVRGSLDVIADAHDLPLSDSSIDGVIIQAVLEHVLDPVRVVNEIYRVLVKNGLVYAETPFMQMVHEREYDFTRFTDLGHRWLFRKFIEIDRGLTAGPGVTLLWAWCYFLRSFFGHAGLAKAAVMFGRITGMWLLPLDRFLAKKAGSYDACSGTYFLGAKADKVLGYKDLLNSYRGIRD